MRPLIHVVTALPISEWVATIASSALSTMPAMQLVFVLVLLIPAMTVSPALTTLVSLDHNAAITLAIIKSVTMAILALDKIVVCPPIPSLDVLTLPTLRNALLVLVLLDRLTSA